MVGVVLDSLDGILDEPDHALSQDNVPPHYQSLSFFSQSFYDVRMDLGRREPLIAKYLLILTTGLR